MIGNIEIYYMIFIGMFVACDIVLLHHVVRKEKKI